MIRLLAIFALLATLCGASENNYLKPTGYRFYVECRIRGTRTVYQKPHPVIRYDYEESETLIIERDATYKIQRIELVTHEHTQPWIMYRFPISITSGREIRRTVHTAQFNSDDDFAEIINTYIARTELDFEKMLTYLDDGKFKSVKTKRLLEPCMRFPESMPHTVNYAYLISRDQKVFPDWSKQKCR